MVKIYLSNLARFLAKKLTRTMESAIHDEIRAAEQSLHELELHQLQVLKEMEHYHHAKAELVERLARLRATET